MESTQQDSGCVARHRRSEGIQSARGPQGLCENLINALKMLANQQKDGDGPIQDIVAGLQERSREGIMNGL